MWDIEIYDGSPLQVSCVWVFEVPVHFARFFIPAATKPNFTTNFDML